MSFIIQPVVESDGVEWARIFYYAFQSTLGYLWYGEPTDEGFVQMSVEHTATLKEPDTFTFKAVDRSSNEMIGTAQWQIFRKAPSKEEVDAMFSDTGTPPPQVNHEARTALLEDVALSRKELMTSEPCVLLRVLIVSPKYQRKGAGTLLMQWGLEKMDECAQEYSVDCRFLANHVQTWNPRICGI
jgi:hypothetical protein